MCLIVDTICRSVSHGVCEIGRRCKGSNLTLDCAMVFICSCGDDIKVVAVVTVVVVLWRAHVVGEEHVDLLS